MVSALLLVKPIVQEPPLEKDRNLRGLIFPFHLRLFSSQFVIGSQGPLSSWQLSALFCDKGKDLQWKSQRNWETRKGDGDWEICNFKIFRVSIISKEVRGEGANQWLWDEIILQ